MFSALLSLGSKYVPSILQTIGGGLSKLIGGSSVVKTVGSKIRQQPILSQMFNIAK